MKKILFILLVFCGVHANAQKVKAEVIELDTLTTTERNALTVPLGKVQIVYDETIGNFYGNVKNGGWVTLASIFGALETSDLIDDDTFATATATNVASAESIKAYVDANSGSGDLWSDPVDSDILPTAVDLWDLGSPTLRFENGYVDRFNVEQLTGEVRFTQQSTSPFSGEGNAYYDTDDNRLAVHDGTTGYRGLAYFDEIGGGSSPPFDDNSPHIRDNVDNSKTITIVADNITTATNRNLTMPDADVDLGNMVTPSSTNTLTNKTIDADNNTISNIGSAEIDLTMTPTWSGLHTFSNGTYYSSGNMNLGDSRFYTGEDEGVSGRRWHIEKSAATDKFSFSYQQSDQTTATGGIYTGLYTLDESGIPVSDTDLTDIAYINTRILNTAFGAGWSSVTANSPSQASVYTEMIKKLNSVTTGEPTGSDAISNIVSLTQAEYDAGTPVAGTYYLITDPVTPEVIQIACSDLTTDVTTGTSKAYFRMPWAATLTDVRVSLLTAGTSTGLTVDINESGTTVLSTKLTTDATEKTSETATTAAVISDSALADDAEITIDFDAVPTGGQGVIVTLYVEY